MVDWKAERPCRLLWPSRGDTGRCQPVGSGRGDAEEGQKQREWMSHQIGPILSVWRVRTELSPRAWPLPSWSFL